MVSPASSSTSSTKIGERMVVGIRGTGLECLIGRSGEDSITIASCPGRSDCSTLGLRIEAQDV